MASGIKVNGRVKETFENMKVNKASDDSGKRIRLVTCTIQDDEINVCEVYTQDMLGKDGVPEDAYLLLASLMKDDSCFYLLYDCHLETKEGIKKEEMVFGTWIPDTLSLKRKMTYSSSKDSIKNICKGLKHNLQLNDRASVIPRESFAEGLEKATPGIVSIEGVALAGKGRKA